MSTEKCSITELANLVNEWCSAQQVQPLHNGAGLQVTVRSIRYYQSLGLVDRPLSANGQGFNEKHRLQLIGIRLLQAKGLPLGKIQTLLYGRTEEELREVERRRLSEIELSPSMPQPTGPDWKVTPIASDILVLTRSGRDLTAAQRLKIQEILNLEPTTRWDNARLESFRPETD